MTKNEFLSNSIDISDATDNTKFIFRTLKENPVVICKPSEGLSHKPNELLEYHELIYLLIWRDLKVRYKQTVLGVLWAVLQTFLTTVVIPFFFRKPRKGATDSLLYNIFVQVAITMSVGNEAR